MASVEGAYRAGPWMMLCSLMRAWLCVSDLSRVSGCVCVCVCDVDVARVFSCVSLCMVRVD